MKRLFFFLLLAAGLFGLPACNIDADRKVDTRQGRFATTDRTRLFFKNTRLLFYDLTEQPNAQQELYRYADRSTATDKPVINLLIVNKWINDKAYVMVEPNAALQGLDTLNVRWQAPNNVETGSVMLPMSSAMPQHFQFTGGIYDKMQEGCTFQVETAEGWQPVFDDNTTREAFRVTMLDYYRLVGLLD